MPPAPLLLALIVVALLFCLYASSRTLPRGAMAAPVAGELAPAPALAPYFPGWLLRLKKGAPPSEAAVVRGCERDPRCAAVEYTTAAQKAHRAHSRGGEAGPGPASFWAYSAGPAAALPFRPTDPLNGPNLHAKAALPLRAAG